MRVKQLLSLNIIKLEKVKQNYSETNNVEMTFSSVKADACSICKRNLPTFQQHRVGGYQQDIYSTH